MSVSSFVSYTPAAKFGPVFIPNSLLGRVLTFSIDLFLFSVQENDSDNSVNVTCRKMSLIDFKVETIH